MRVRRKARFPSPRLRERLTLNMDEYFYRSGKVNFEDGVVLLNPDNIIEDANQEFFKMISRTKRQVIGHRFSEFFDSEIKRANSHAYRSVLKGEAAERTVLEVRALPIRKRNGNSLGTFLLISDSSDQRRVEEELNRSREELRSLSRHLQSIREDESKRIAREIHDELGQALTALKMDIAWISKRLPPAGANLRKFEEKLESMSGIIDATISKVQKISAELRPGMLDDLGLIAAVDWLVEEFQERTGVRCRLDLRCNDSLLTPECSTVIFRVIQEAMTNIARHARATRATIAIKEDRDKLLIRIRDNGIGIQKRDIVAAESLGFIGMRERIFPYEGTLEIAGAANRGTVVTIVLSLNKARRP